MIEFRLASTGSDVYEAQVNDVRLYLFKLPGFRGESSDNWRLTANLLGLVGLDLATAELGQAQHAALGAVAEHAAMRAEILNQTASQCREELSKRKETGT